MPSFTSAELLPLLECEPGELAARTAALVGPRSAELSQRILELRQRARELVPPPTSEELCLGLLSLFALDGAGR